MRLALPLALVCLIVTGCPQPPPFDITITNAGTTTSYLNAGNSSGVLMRIDQEIGGTWRPLSSNLGFLCAAQCGTPGPITCADAAAELLVPHALLPGDSAIRSFDGDFWYTTTTGCAQKASLTGPLRATLWHDGVLVDQNGDAQPEPTASGPVDDSGSGEFMLEDALEESFPFDLTGRSQVVLEVVEDQ